MIAINLEIVSSLDGITIYAVRKDKSYQRESVNPYLIVHFVYSYAEMRQVGRSVRKKSCSAALC